MSAANGGKVVMDEPARRVVRLLINRPDKRNAIDHDVRQGLIEALTQLDGKRGAGALVLGGQGGHFSAGGDLPSMVGLGESQARDRMQQIAQLCRLVSGLNIPVVTAMQGVSAGACVGLALLGDQIVVGGGTRVMFPFLKLGLVPDWGLLQTLPARIGRTAACKLLWTSANLSGAAAADLGLADECVSDDAVMTAAVTRAAELAQLPRAAFARMKARLALPSVSLDEELRREQEDQVRLLLGDDFREGLAAFMAGRPPDFLRRGGGP
jgi:2-(1,2-epoxy-1,2-dihydrophenyl)acetyl-CoA isomerase